MRTIRRGWAVKVPALLLIFSMAQVYVGVSLALPSQGGPLTGQLITKDNQSILVNGVSLKSGGTILSGATIEVPDGVGATINLGPLGSIDLAPNTKVMIEFEDGKVKVKLIQGCVIMRTKKGTDGEINTEQGNAATTDKKNDAVADVCFPPGAPSPIVNAGAAANAGAGAGPAGLGAGVGGGGLSVQSTLFIVFGIIGGGVLTYALLNEGDNPSPSTPQG
jgi:hypothetical protein